MRDYSDEELDVIGKTCPLIKAWGEASEQMRDTTQEFQALVALKKANPIAVNLALEFAQGFQAFLISNNEPTQVNVDHPSHPIQRLAGVQMLSSILQCY